MAEVNNEFYRQIDVAGINTAVDNISQNFKKELFEDLGKDNGSKDVLDFFADDKNKGKWYQEQYKKYVDKLESDIKDKIYIKIKNGEQLNLKYSENDFSSDKAGFLESLQSLKIYAEKDEPGNDIGKSFTDQEQKIADLTKKLDNKEFDNGYRETLIKSKAGLRRRIVSKTARYRKKIQEIEKKYPKPEQRLVAFMKKQMKGRNWEIGKRIKFRRMYGSKGRIAPEDMKDVYSKFEKAMKSAINSKNIAKSVKARANLETIQKWKKDYENTPAGKIIWG